mmetsp:Transcript_19794/g.31462  ORF Transcript_19794/g.31462 Transcript_19794/m.31462 type:complete len:235 (+) Transcript_19794:302-1006(+)
MKTVVSRVEDERVVQHTRLLKFGQNRLHHIINRAQCAQPLPVDSVALLDLRVVHRGDVPYGLVTVLSRLVPCGCSRRPPPCRCRLVLWRRREASMRCGCPNHHVKGLLLLALSLSLLAAGASAVSMISWGCRCTCTSATVIIIILLYKSERPRCQDVSEIVLLVDIPMDLFFPVVADCVVVIPGVAFQCIPIGPSWWHVRCSFRSVSACVRKSVIVEVLSGVECTISCPLHVDR